MIQVLTTCDAPEVLRGFADMEQAMNDFKLPLERGAVILATSTKKGFDTGGFPEKWEPLKRASSNRLAPTPLMKTGDLMRAATDTTGSVPFSGYHLTKDEVTIGVTGNKPGAVENQLGTKTIPARAYLLVRDGDVDKIVDEFVSWADSLAAQCFG